ITPAELKTVAGPRASNSRSTVAGSRTSPITVSTDGPTISSSGACSATCTRQRTRSRSPARARTRFWPSQPAAPVTTATPGAFESGVTATAYSTGLVRTMAQPDAAPRCGRGPLPAARIRDREAQERGGDELRQRRVGVHVLDASARVHHGRRHLVDHVGGLAGALPAHRALLTFEPKPSAVLARPAGRLLVVVYEEQLDGVLVRGHEAPLETGCPEPS